MSKYDLWKAVSEVVNRISTIETHENVCMDQYTARIHHIFLEDVYSAISSLKAPTTVSGDFMNTKVHNMSQQVLNIFSKRKMDNRNYNPTPNLI